MELGGLHSNWKQRAQVQPTIPSASVAARSTAPPLPAKLRVNPASDGDDLDPMEQVNGGLGEIGVDEDEASLEAVRQSKASAAGAKRSHKGGTKGVSHTCQSCKRPVCSHNESDGHQAQDCRRFCCKA